MRFYTSDARCDKNLSKVNIKIYIYIYIYRLSTFTAARLSVFRLLKRSYTKIWWRSHGLLVTWYVGHRACWSHGLLVTWPVGHMACWSHGLLITWPADHMACWSHGLLVTWPFGHMACWSHGLLVTWPVGHMACWSHGLLVTWPVGDMKEQFYRGINIDKSFMNNIVQRLQSLKVRDLGVIVDQFLYFDDHITTIRRST